MNFYVVSPNASNNLASQGIWEKVILQNNVALMGWGPDNKFGKMFSDDVQIGDFILIAQGSNKNKKVLLGGIVSSDVKVKTFEVASESKFFRELSSVMNKNTLESLNLDFNGSAYGDAAQIPAIYRLYPDKNKNDKAIIEKIASRILTTKTKNNMLDFKSLLEYKKQIILQGPPGTGKTRLAKEIAKTITKRKDINDGNIKNLIHPGLVIPSSTHYTHYTVLSVTNTTVQVQLENGGSDYPISFKDIKKAFQVKLWEGGQKNGSDPYAAAISKYIYTYLESEEVGIIQFHPAYSYDDFVRGIVVDTSEGVVTYKAVNKIFAEMAQRARENYQDSRKSPEQLFKEQEVNKYLELFRDHLEDLIENHDGKLILEGTTTYLFQVEEDAVRYTGDNWKLVTGQRLLFADIKTLFISGANSRKEIKTNPSVSGLAKQHSSYFLRVLKLFRAFVAEKGLQNVEQKTVEERPFVLIIDEINRANLPSVLGELIYGLEYRGKPVESMYELNGSRKLIIPPNFYIIGTMNTADRSVGHIDYAIRRRFAFLEVLPSINPISNALAKEMFEKVSKFFVSNYQEVIYTQASPKRADTLMPDFRPEDVWIGHSYFLTDKKVEQEANDEIKIKMSYEVLPLLKEYVKDGILRSDDTKSNDPVQKLIQELSKL